MAVCMGSWPPEEKKEPTQCTICTCTDTDRRLIYRQGSNRELGMNRSKRGLGGMILCCLGKRIELEEDNYSCRTETKELMGVVVALEVYY